MRPQEELLNTAHTDAHNWGTRRVLHPLLLRTMALQLGEDYQVQQDFDHKAADRALSCLELYYIARNKSRPGFDEN